MGESTIREHKRQTGSGQPAKWIGVREESGPRPSFATELARLAGSLSVQSLRQQAQQGGV